MARFLAPFLCIFAGCPAQFGWNDRLDPIELSLAVITLAGIGISVWIALTLNRINKIVSRQTSDRTVLIGHTEEIIELANQMHQQLSHLSGEKLTAQIQEKLATDSDDILRHFELLILGIQECGMKKKGNWLEVAKASCDEYRDHCTSLSPQTPISVQFLATERSMHLSALRSLEKLHFGIHRME